MSGIIWLGKSCPVFLNAEKVYKHLQEFLVPTIIGEVYGIVIEPHCPRDLTVRAGYLNSKLHWWGNPKS